MSWFDQEAIESEKRDSDIELANFENVGKRLTALSKKGICYHGHVKDETFNKPDGKVTCFGCGKVWNSDKDWYTEYKSIIG